MSRRSKLLGIFLAVLLLTGQLWAQNGGKIAGIITDKQTGEPMVGANVLIENTSFGAAADFDGNYVILRVPPGKYTVSVVYIGYQKTTYKDVEVLTDLTTHLDFAISPEVFEGDEIVVTAETPVIRKDLTSVESRVQAEDIEKLPVQELGDLIDMQAGVTRDAGGAIHIRGGRSAEVGYMVNGISITDDFSRTQALQVENGSIQELQVISGTFNAEYGNAMSGIINIVTKTGDNDFKANLEMWTADHVLGDLFNFGKQTDRQKRRSETFYNLDKISPADNYNFQGNISGPLIPNKLTFFATVRRYYSDGWLYGQNRYKPQGEMGVNEDGDTVLVVAEGDGRPVAMNYTDRWSGQASLDWQLSSWLKFRVDVLGSREKKNYYNHYVRYNPLGDRADNEQGLTVISKLTHQLGQKTFQELTFAYKYNDLVSVLYDDVNDPRYAEPDPTSIVVGVQQFSRYGNDLSRFKRYSQSKIAKWELTSQVSKRNQMKTGIDLQYDEVFYNSYTPLFNHDWTSPDERFSIPSTDELGHDRFTRNPFKLAAYVQDKVEYESLIINLGLRFDLFDANGKVPADSKDPSLISPYNILNVYNDLNGNGEIDENEFVDENKKTIADRRSYWYKDTKAKYLLSPRVGIAYPISERGVVHFSYGIFQQIPDYSMLYVGDQIKLSDASGVNGVFGNPDLKPQRTIMYELGLQQQFTDNLSIDVTGYFRDIRDWTSTSYAIPTYRPDVSYVVFTNRDFANVRGITLSVDRKLANYFAFTVDYTYQITEGTNSDPTQEFFATQSGEEPTKTLTPLNWDQRHAINANLFVGTGDYGASLTANFNSGQPYTPSLVTGTRTGQSIISGLRSNSRSKPNQFNLDFNVFKNIKYAGMNFQLFLKVFNLLDSDNPVNIFTDTGQVDYTLYMLTRPDDADEDWFDIPSFYSEPRRIQVGTKISFGE